MARLTIRDLTKCFGDLIAVNTMNLEVEEGEFITLLGPSGCGKTTTLRTIAGFIHPDSGEIYFNERLMNYVPANKRNTAMVFQSYALFPHMNVWDNVSFGLRMKKVPKVEQRRRVREIIELVGLAGMEKRKPGQLSGGQQQRVALARAVVTEPTILLFDEPLSNLDAKLRERVRVEIRELQRRLKITSIYVTHDQAEALVISDRIVVMNEGRIEQVADPFAIYRYPKTSFVADFIGLANIHEGNIVEKKGGKIVVDTELGSLILSVGAKVVKQRILFSWRPEDMILYEDGMSNLFRGKILQSIFMGNLTDLIVQVNEKTVRAQVGSYEQYREGSEISLSVPEDKFHIIAGNEY
jgi:iron(III) transport system ATP-binding protein